MQRSLGSLGFAPITAEAAQLQLQRIAAEAERAASEAAAAAVARRVEEMSVVKPLVLQWCIDSWSALGVEKGRAYVKMGWHSCCLSLFNVFDGAKRAQVVEAARGEIEAAAFIPAEQEQEAEDEPSEDEEDEDKDELDALKERQYGSRKSERKRAAPKNFGFLINSQQIALSEDSS
jgi:hypothetical protein